MTTCGLLRVSVDQMLERKSVARRFHHKALIFVCVFVCVCVCAPPDKLIFALQLSILNLGVSLSFFPQYQKCYIVSKGVAQKETNKKREPAKRISKEA